MLRCLLFLLMTAGALPAASLYTAETLADGTLYSDQVARRSGDLITILVKETTKITDNSKTERKRANDVSAQVTLLPGLEELPAAAGQSANGRLPAMALGSDKNFKGEGKFEATGDVRAVITGRVTDVLDNGNLVIEGRRQVTIGPDTKTILVTGVVRPADVRTDNTVMSEKIHAFQVAIAGEGPLSQSQEEGFVGRLLDLLWPF
ncbi:flagellar L-ring protein [Planctomycetota bacterium]|nr:flagellar L-ring protein [Planctomycetota bacterium]